MPTRPDSALASLLLTNRLVETPAKPFTAAEHWSLLERVGDPAQLLGLGADALASSVGLPPELAQRVATLLDAGTGLAVELERLEQQGLHVLSAFDEAYPRRLRERLGSAAPPILHVAGPPQLLARDGVGVVGSRGVDETGTEVARRVGVAAAERDLVLVSGGAKGVDSAAMNAAIEAGGAVVGVLADALTARLRKPDVRRTIGRGQVCLITPHKPTAGFSAANAMGRNKLIYALAEVTVVVAADADQGGTWTGATEALRRGFGAVAVWTGPGAGDGNAEVVARGGRAIADVDRVFDPPPPPEARAEQLHLGV